MVPFANLRTALILITYLNCYDVQILGRRLLALSAITSAEKEEDSMADIQDWRKGSWPEWRWKDHGSPHTPPRQEAAGATRQSPTPRTRDSLPGWRDIDGRWMPGSLCTARKQALSMFRYLLGHCASPLDYLVMNAWSAFAIHSWRGTFLLTNIFSVSPNKKVHAFSVTSRRLFALASSNSDVTCCLSEIKCCLLSPFPQ